MSRTIRELASIFTSDTASFDAGLRRMQSGLQNFQSAVQAAAPKVQQAFKDIDAAATRVGVAVGGMVTAATGYLATLGLQTAASQQTTLISLKAMLGDADKAQAYFNTLRQKAMDSPFELQGLTVVSKSLLAAGVSAEKSLPMLDAIVETVSAIGGNQETLQGVGRAFGQMISKGKVSAEEMQQLAERGIPAWQLLADTLGVSVPQAMKMAENGAVSADTAVAGMLQRLMAQYKGSSKELSLTTEGMLSSIRDLVSNAAMEIFQPLSNALGGVMFQAISAMQSSQFTAFIQQLSQQVQMLVNRSGLMNLTSPGWWQGLLGSLQEASTRFIDFTNKAAAVIPTVQSLASSILNMVTYVLRLLETYPQLILWFSAWQVAKLSGMVSLFQSLVAFVPGMLKLVDAATALGIKLLAVGTAMTGLTAGPLIGIVALLGVLATAIYKAVEAWQAYNAAAKESDRLEQQRITRVSAVQDKRLSEIDAMPIGQKENVLATELETARKNAIGLEAQLRAARLELQRLNTTYGQAVDATVGNAMLRAVKQEVKDIQDSQQANVAYIRKLEAMGDQVESNKGGYIAGGQETLKGVEPDFKPGQSLLADLRAKDAPKSPEGFEQLKAAMSMQWESSNQLAEVIHRMTGLGVQASQAYAAAAIAYKDSPNLINEIAARAFTGAENQREALKRREELVKPTERFNNELQSQEGVLPQSQLDGFGKQFAGLRSQYMQGQIGQEQFGAGSERLNTALRGAEQLQGVFSRLGEALPSSQIDLFRQRFDQLSASFTSGNITAGNFEARMRELNNEVHKAADAARQEAAEKEKAFKQRVVEGNMTKEDKEKLQGLQKGAAEKKADSELDAAFNKIVGLGEAGQRASEGLGKVEQSSGKAAEKMDEQAESGGLNQQNMEMLNAAANLLSSTAGQRALIEASINSLYALMKTLATLPGAYEKQQRVLEDIRELQERLTRLPENSFIGQATDPLFNDPGLARGDTTVNVNASFPNFTRISSAEARALTETVRNEMSRLGGRPFGG